MSGVSSQVLIALCAPFLILLIGAEFAFSRRLGIRAYRSLNETFSNLSCGIGQQLIDLFLNVAVLLGYVAVQSSFGLPPVAPSVASFLALFVLIDGIYYAYHRLSHHVPLLWAVHQVHHQSEEFNFSVGLRQAWFHKLVSFPIYVVPALLGFPPELYVPVAALHAILQTWTHTRLIRSPMRWISWLLVVPYTHRVHHGANGECVNKNFGGIFSVWDRLFGSHHVARIEPVYGIVDGPGTWDPWVANFSPVASLFSEVKRTSGVGGKLRALFLPGQPGARETDREIPTASRPFHAALLYAAILVPSVVFFGIASDLSQGPRIAGVVGFLVALSWFGRNLDQETGA
jgi:alkylglycerol monooxygenase